MSGETVFERIRLDANKTIFEEGDRADAVYVIREGAVAIRVNMNTATPHTRTTLRKGEVIGELALIEGRVHRATAVTTEPTLLVKIPGTEFLRRLVDLDPMMKLVVDDLVRKLADATERLEGDEERYGRR
ncbi:MAG: cyclic nucleotide-binding domain-containing protein [Rhodospirillales bacterium]